MDKRRPYDPARTEWKRFHACHECKKAFVAGEEIVWSATYWFHPPCHTAHTQRITERMHAKKSKESWIERHGRVIKKGGGL